MQRLFLLFLILLNYPAAFCQTSLISSFDDLISSLNSGEEVRVVIKYANCDRTPEDAGLGVIPDAIAGMSIDTYEYFAAGAVRNDSAFVVFSESKLIQNPLGKGFVYNYGKLRVNSDNSVIVLAKYLHPKSYKVLMNESFISYINNGNNNGGVTFYK